ncbi:MAG: L-seryl-tRNA(Sec) selenium transferase, partial [Mycobacteriales bacterium]
MDDQRRNVPRTDAVLADPRLAEAQHRLGREVVKAAVRRAQGRVRADGLVPDLLVESVLADLPARLSGLHPVINATGVLLHTNLGRAPLSAPAVDALVAAAGPTDVEYDLGMGDRAVRGRT